MKNFEANHDEKDLTILETIAMCLIKFGVDLIIKLGILLIIGFAVGVIMFLLLAWLGCWIGLFEYSGLNPMHGLMVGLLTFVLILWVRKKIAGRIW